MGYCLLISFCIENRNHSYSLSLARMLLLTEPDSVRSSQGNEWSLGDPNWPFLLSVKGLPTDQPRSLSPPASISISTKLSQPFTTETSLFYQQCFADRKGLNIPLPVADEKHFRSGAFGTREMICDNCVPYFSFLQSRLCIDYSPIPNDQSLSIAPRKEWNIQGTFHINFQPNGLNWW